MLDSCDGGYEIRHYEDGIDAAVADGGRDCFHHLVVAEVDVHVGGGGEGEVIEEAHCGGRDAGIFR